MPLVEQTLRTLFGGVTRQPPAVRRENQVEEQKNALTSIVTGGFEKRPAATCLNKLTTVNNLLLWSEKFDEAEWVGIGTPAVALVDTFGGDPPFGNAVYSITDNDGVAFEGVQQTVTGLLDPALQEYIIGIDIRNNPSNTATHATITATGDVTGFLGEAVFDFGTNTLTHAGPNVVDDWVETLGNDWFRLIFWISLPAGDDEIEFAITVGQDAAGLGSVYLSRAQIEHITDIDQETFSPYAYTEDAIVPREANPGSVITDDLFVHGINRDAEEQYMLLLGNNQAYIYSSFDGRARQLSFTDSTRYFAVDLSLAATGQETTQIWFIDTETACDYTLVHSAAAGNPDVVIEHSVDGVAWDLMHTEATLAGAATVPISDLDLQDGAGADYHFVRIRVSVAGSAGVVSVRGVYKDTALINAGSPQSEDFAAVSVADHSFVINKNIIPRMGEVGNHEGFSTILGTYQTFTSLPAAEVGNFQNLAEITGDDVDNFSGYWVVCDEANGMYFWRETSSPNDANVFNPATMPWEIRKLETGRFEISSGDWEPRPVGSQDSNPHPTFVDKPISNIFFYRGRLGLLSDESLVMSSAHDVYLWFAEKTLDVLATDPIDRTAQTERVAILDFAVAFRKLLFVTSTSMQFELSAGDSLTPESAALDATSQYTASNICKPAMLGDTLFFAVSRPDGSSVYEYYYDEEGLTNQAIDVSSHIPKYIDNPAYQFAVDPVTGTLFVLTVASDKLFMYKTFWSDKEKVLSSWGELNYGNSFIHGIQIFGEYLLLVVSDGTDTFLLQQPVDTEAIPTNMPYVPYLDYRLLRDGIYDGVADETTWFVPYDTDDTTRVIKGGNWPASETGAILPIASTGPHSITVNGDYSDFPCYVGNNYDMEVEFSPIFMRDENQVSVTSGRLVLQKAQFVHSNTAYYRIEVDVAYRGTITAQYTAYTTDSGLTLLDEFPLQWSHYFEAPIRGKNTEVTLRVVNDAPLPCTITSMTWRGFYTNKTRKL